MYRKTIISIFLFMFLCATKISFGQWNKINANSSHDFFDVQYLNSNTIITSGWQGIIRSDNGGSTWQRFPLLGMNNLDTIYLTALYDLNFYDSNVGIATGMITLNNSAGILKTVNGGKNWQVVYGDNSGNWPRQFNEISGVAGITYAVGNEGRVIKSADKGDNWQLSSLSTSKNLNSVAVLDKNNIYIAGDGVIYRTINGGYSWSSITFTSTNFYHIKFKDANIGLATSNNGIWRTTDGGATWNKTSQLYLGISVDNKYRVKFFGNDVYLCAAGFIYKSTDSGISWSKLILPFKDYFAIDFLDVNNGVIGGEKDNLYMTNNGGGTIAPLSIINVAQAPYCVDSIIHFSSAPTIASSYQWYIDGVLSGSNSTLNYAFPTGNKSYLVKLIESNGVNNDTSTVAISVEKDLKINLQVGILDNNLCYNYKAKIKVSSSQEDVVYQLRKGNINLGNSQIGNGNDLIFESLPVTSIDTFNIIATKSNACGENTVISYFPVMVGNKLDDVDWKVSTINPAVSEVFVADFVNDTIAYANSSKLLKTIDGGKHWNAINTVEGNIDFVDENVGYAISTSVKKTTDGGKNFTLLSTPWIAPNATHGINFFDANFGFYYTTGSYNSPKQIYKTVDGGSTWKKVFQLYNTELNIGRIERTSNNVLYGVLFCNYQAVNQPDSIIKSIDAGETWFKIPVQSGLGWGLEDIDFLNDNVGYGVSGNRIFKTSDGGSTWVNQLEINMDNEKITFSSIKFYNQSLGYATAYVNTTYSGGVFQSFIYKTIDGGLCWQKVSEFPYRITDVRLNSTNGAIIYGDENFDINPHGIILYNNPIGWPKFSIPSSSICIGDSILATNTSIPNYDSYKWYVDGVLQKSSTNAYLNFSTVGNHTIQLIAKKGSISDTSNLVPVKVDALSSIVISQQPTAMQNGCLSYTYNLSVTASGTSLKYQWQADSGNGFANLSPLRTDILNATTSNLYIKTASMSLSNYTFRCLITGQCATSVYSNTAKITIQSTTQLTKQPLNDTICVNGAANFMIDAVGASLIYQWQYYNGTSYINLTDGTNYSGTGSKTLVINSCPSSLNNYRYCCKVTGSCGTVTSTLAKLFVYGTTSISTHPLSGKACYEMAKFFSVSTTGVTPLKYQWQMDDGTGFKDLVNDTVFDKVNTANLVVITPKYFNGNSFRCKITTWCSGELISNSAILTLATPVSITANLPDVSVCEGVSLLLEYSIANGYSPLVQFQVNNGSGFINTTPSYSPSLPFGVGDSNFLYRYIVTDCGIDDTSNIAHILVKNAPDILVQPQTMSRCEGSNVKVAIVPSAGNYTYQWYKVYTALNDAGNIHGSHSDTLTISKAVSGDASTYSCEVNNGVCKVKSSNAVLSLTTAPSCYLSTQKTICSEATASLFGYLYIVNTGSWSSTGDGNFTTPTFVKNGSVMQTNTVYTPGANDIQNGVVNIVLTPQSAACPGITDTLKLIVDVCTSTTLLHNDGEISVSPNPFNDYLLVASEKEIRNYYLVNSLGQLLLESKFTGSSKQLTLKTESLCEGLYYLRITMNDGSTYCEKIVK